MSAPEDQGLKGSVKLFGHVEGQTGSMPAVIEKGPTTGRSIVTVGAEVCSAQDWNDFAKQCGATFRGSYHASLMFGFDTHFLFRVRRFACYVGQDQARHKIAQAAVSVGIRLRVFIDPVAMLPGYEPLWNDVMAALLAELGPGTYRYGCPWSLEMPRDFTGLVERVDVRQQFNLYLINFNRWATWSDYMQNVSSNAVRQARRAVQQHDKNLTLETHWELGHSNISLC